MYVCLFQRFHPHPFYDCQSCICASCFIHLCVSSLKEKNVPMYLNCVKAPRSHLDPAPERRPKPSANDDCDGICALAFDDAERFLKIIT